MADEKETEPKIDNSCSIDRTKEFETSSIKISGKEKVVYNGFMSLYRFCFFCGKEIGPGKNTTNLDEMCKNENWKRRPHYAFSGRRWICEPCRNVHRKSIDEAVRLMKEGKFPQFE